MFRDKKVVVVMPAYNAAKTLAQTYREVMEQGVVDQVIVVDDASRDDTVSVAKTLPKTMVFTHSKNLGYGGNQKSCYRLALQAGADIIIMVHPDSQYTPKLIPAMVSLIAADLYPCVLGSRILGGYALRGGMPVWRYVANRFLTAAENLLLGAKLSEYHTGYRAFSREALESLPLSANSDDFVFDNQVGRFHDCGDQLSDQVFCGGFVNRFLAERAVRVWVPVDGVAIPAGENGGAGFAALSAAGSRGRRGGVKNILKNH
jgi:glycosyltransferase involved in cell wall biosynthesis